MESASTENLTALPEPGTLRRTCRVLATLGSLLDPDEQPHERYHSYDPSWAEGVHLARVDNGAGDNMFCFFSPAGTVIRGFDHESPVSPHGQVDQEQFRAWPGMFDGLPASLSVLLDDLASADDREDFREEVTFCLWWPASSMAWQIGPVQIPPEDDDGSGFLLGTLFPTAEDYVDWAQVYYSREIPVEPVRRVYERLTLDEKTAREINPQLDYEAVRQEIQSILA